MALLLIDTYSLFFRSFYGLPPMTTQRGQPTGALYGFSALLLKLLREQEPAGCALALDLPTPTFRQALAPSYKAGRPSTPSPLRAQLEVLPELLEAFGFPCFEAPGFEADDVLASLAHELAQAGEQCLVASGDRDLLQLVTAQVHVLFLGARGKPAQRYEPGQIVTRFGIPAGTLPSYVALLGDSSDNLPKVPGIGEVTAQRLLAKYGDVHTLLQHVHEIAEPRVRQTLTEHEAQIRSTEQLARLRRDVPLAPGPRTQPFTHAAVERTQVLFERLEFKSLIARLGPWRKPGA
jgi:DNA polymerase-1